MFIKFMYLFKTYAD